MSRNFDSDILPYSPFLIFPRNPIWHHIRPMFTFRMSARPPSFLILTSYWISREFMKRRIVIHSRPFRGLRCSPRVGNLTDWYSRPSKVIHSWPLLTKVHSGGSGRRFWETSPRVGSIFLVMPSPVSRGGGSANHQFERHISSRASWTDPRRPVEDYFILGRGSKSQWCSLGAIQKWRHRRREGGRSRKVQENGWLLLFKIRNYIVFAVTGEGGRSENSRFCGDVIFEWPLTVKRTCNSPSITFPI